MSATRLPGKPLFKINGLSIIYHVYKKALQTKIGEVYVATEDKEIYEDVVSNGGRCIITSNEHKTGMDRIFEAYKKLNISNVDYILNLQGDEPLIDVNDIKGLHHKITKSEFQIGTLACKIDEEIKYHDQNIVKVKTKEELNKSNISKALDFFRNQENSDKKNLYHHIGIYLYKINTLNKLVSTNQTQREKIFRLEQLRALDNNMEIFVTLAKSSPIGVDTKEDFIKVKNLLETKN